ncbi:crossover junction endodeoxyribonuclease RuvC [[Mycobacterium] crassicus]|uniref:Crossover junction endodeoxyribonuclease RuvC n=1 Tax=[Mycobacterium] crassicus TaxID=2872309 RepID=A0ABU5XG74_9MYCO|nr:crossover junction endodeoxyribonuclease RuvC [Mycolicibacter sp. MYC098]MEB3021292.1 crossover junction endodeoxyribonuclease RuvC [Mycolicibacter sp. MYC098]
MIVAGIDPSLTNCGIAILEAGQPVHLDAVGHAGKDGASYDHRSRRIVSQCRCIISIITTHTPDLAVIEGPAYGHNLPSNHDRAGLWWGLYSALRAKHIPTAVVAPGTRAKWATGHGRAGKADVLKTVRAWWPDTTIRNHDIADAAVLATLGAFHAGDPMPFPVKPRHQVGADVIDWPEVTTP